MKQNFFRVTVSNHFQAVIQFLRRELGWKAGDPLVSELSISPRLRWVLFCVSLIDLIYVTQVHVYKSRILTRA